MTCYGFQSEGVTAIGDKVRVYQFGLAMGVALLLGLAMVATNGLVAPGLVRAYAAGRKSETRAILNRRGDLLGSWLHPRR